MARPKRFTHPDPEIEAKTIAEMKKQYHRDKRAERKKLGKELGHCTKCTGERVGDTLFCEHHWYQDRAMARLGTTIHAAALNEQMEKQEYCCYYTGKPLVIGVNASLDHKLSIKNHPELEHDVNNVVWCLKEINWMKSGMDDEEFLANCKLISSRF